MLRKMPINPKMAMKPLYWTRIQLNTPKVEKPKSPSEDEDDDADESIEEKAEEGEDKEMKDEEKEEKKEDSEEVDTSKSQTITKKKSRRSKKR